MFLTIKLCTLAKLNCLYERLICHKTHKQTNQPLFVCKWISIYHLFVLSFVRDILFSNENYFLGSLVLQLFRQLNIFNIAIYHKYFYSILIFSYLQLNCSKYCYLKLTIQFDSHLFTNNILVYFSNNSI